MTKDFLTTTQAAHILNVHPDTLRRWEKAGKIKSLRFINRGHRRYPASDILKIIKSRTEEETVPSLTLYRIHQKINEKSRGELIKMFNNAECIFFDVGHTLISLFPSREDVYMQIAYDHGFHVDPSEIRLHFNRVGAEYQKSIEGKPSTSMTASQMEEVWANRNSEVLHRAGVPRAESMAIGKQLFNEVWGNSSLWRKFSHVEDLLNELKAKRKKLGVIDNWDKRLIKILKDLDLLKYFDVVVLGGEEGIWKPDVRIFEIALSKLHAKAKNALYIGDNYTTDFLGATRANFNSILFDNQFKYLDKKIPKFYKFETLIKH